MKFYASNGRSSFAVLGIALSLLSPHGWADAQDGEPGGDPLKRGKALMAANQVVKGSIERMLADAQRDGAIVRTSCLIAKLTEVKTHNGMAEKRFQAVKEAHNDAKRKHELNVLKVIGERVALLETEAQQCIGENVFQTGTTRVQTDLDPVTAPNDAVPPGMPPPISVNDNVTISTPVSGTM